MKKIWFILLSTSILFLFWCSKESSQQDEYTEVIWTITYHNPELDRWEGQETRLDRIVKLYIEWKDGFIQLWCIANEYSLKLDSDVILPVLNQDKTYSFIIIPSSQILNDYLSGELVKLKITKPIFDYKLSVELPDRGRIWDCTADVKSKDIQVITR